MFVGFVINTCKLVNISFMNIWIGLLLALLLLSTVFWHLLPVELWILPFHISPSRRFLKRAFLTLGIFRIGYIFVLSITQQCLLIELRSAALSSAAHGSDWLQLLPPTLPVCRATLVAPFFVCSLSSLCHLIVGSLAFECGLWGYGIKSGLITTILLCTSG